MGETRRPPFTPPLGQGGVPIASVHPVPGGAPFMLLQGTHDGENWVTIEESVGADGFGSPIDRDYLVQFRAIRSVPIQGSPPSTRSCRFCRAEHDGHCSVVQKLGDEFFDSEWATSEDTYKKAEAFLSRYFIERNRAAPPLAPVPESGSV